MPRLKLNITIDTGDDDAVGGDQPAAERPPVMRQTCRDALAAIQGAIDDRETEGILRDANGNTIGKWSMDMDPED